MQKHTCTNMNPQKQKKQDMFQDGYVDQDHNDDIACHVSKTQIQAYHID